MLARCWTVSSRSTPVAPPNSPRLSTRASSGGRLARLVHKHARRVGARRRGRGSAPAASPTRLNRRPAGGAPDEGVHSAGALPRPRRHPPRSHGALANSPGEEAVGESAHDALDHCLPPFRSERGLCPRNRILGGRFGRGAMPPRSVLADGARLVHEPDVVGGYGD